MLSWDDFNKEENQSAPVVESAKLQPEVVESAAPETTPMASNPISSSSTKDVSEALESLDIEAGLKELEGASGRVDVDQKQMIN